MLCLNWIGHQDASNVHKDECRVSCANQATWKIEQPTKQRLTNELTTCWEGMFIYCCQRSSIQLSRPFEETKLRMACPPVEYGNSLLEETIVLSSVMVAALVGNVLVGLVFYKVRTLRSNVNCFFVNMALSDVLFPLVVLPKILVSKYHSGQWLIAGAIGKFLCPLSFFLQDVSTAASISSLVLISFERFVAVVFPLKIRQLTPTLRAWCIAFTWITAVAWSSPLFYAVKLKETTNYTLCSYDWAPAFDHTKASKTYALALFFGLWLVPAIVMSALYTVTAISMAKNKTRISRRSSQRRKQTRKVLILSIAVMLSFYLCWVPFHVYVLLFVFSDICKSTIVKLINPALYLAFSSTAVNPILLFTFSQKFRKGLISLFCRDARGNKQTTRGIQTTSARNATILNNVVWALHACILRVSRVYLVPAVSRRVKGDSTLLKTLPNEALDN